MRLIDADELIKDRAEEKRIEINFNSEELLDFCYGRDKEEMVL